MFKIQSARALAAAASVLLFLAACESGTTGGSAQEAPVSLDNDNAKFSYAIGVDVARSLEQVDDRVDIDALVAGMRDANGGGDLKLTTAEMEGVKETVRTELQAAQRADAEAQTVKAKQAGQAYLEANAKKEGVSVTDSGLQYKVLEAADGTKPKATDTVKVHYKGTLLNGETFDSSYDRGEPAEFPLNGVIKGWTEGLQLMPVGSKYEFTIPSDLAYGDRGAGARIGPHETLVFEVELLEITKEGE